MTKYLVIKSIEGFGDRLECLLQAIGYCNATGRTLVLDWRDPDWYHDESNAIENYLSIRKIPTVPIEQFIEIYDEQSMSVYPSRWSGDKLVTDAYHKFIYNRSFHIPQGNDMLYKISRQQSPDYTEQVVVYPGVRNRSWKYKCMEQIAFTDTILDAVAEIRKHNRGRYNALHMRAGTKQWMSGFHPIKKLNNKLVEKYPNKISYIRYLHYQLAKIDPTNKLPLLICSDSETLVEDWLLQTNVGEYISTTHCDLMSTGTHKIPKNKLKLATKHQLNIETLRDFIILCDARHVISDEVSTFSQMAKRCKIVY